MQKQILPIQVSGASPAPARSKAAQPEGGAQFNQTLNREIEQRKAPPPQAKSNGPAKPQQQQAQNTDKAGAPKKTGNEPQRVAKDKAGAKDAAAEEGAAQAAAAAGQNPVIDMMALVASFNNLSGANMAATDGADPLQGGTGAQVMDGKFAAAMATAGLDKLAVAGAALMEGGAPEVQPAVFSNMMAQLDGKSRDGGKPVGADNASQMGQDKAALGKDLAAANRPLDAGQGKAVPDASQFAQMRAREAIALEPAPKELQVTAPGAAPVQQSSLALANAANGAAADKIAARVGTPGWDNQVGQKIVWMVAGKEQMASLTLNPPEMGPMQVVLNVTNDHATVTFSSATPEVRQALEDAMPKLREMMSESGISLGNASVNDGSAQQQQQARDESGGRGVRGGVPGTVENTASGSAAEAEARAAARPTRAGELPGLVDTFA